MVRSEAGNVAGRTRQPIERNGPAGYAAEFIGTAILVAAIGFVISNGAVAAPDFAALALLHVFVLMMLIATLGGTSGAHFNPAVTVTLAALRKIAWVEAGIYIGMQLLGAVAGALLVKLLLDDEGARVSYGGVASRGHHRQLRRPGLPRRAPRDLSPDVGDHGHGGQPTR